MAATVIIPARLGSTRFPAKMLAAETGRPLVQHVVEQVSRCTRVRQVLVATDDTRIVEALRPFGTRCVMTSEAHQSGTDRIAEVVRGNAVASDKLLVASNQQPATSNCVDGEIIVNVQGDEPEIEPQIVDRLIERLEGSDCEMATVATRLAADQNPADPNLVKVVLGLDGRAIYFSRWPIPFHRDGGEAGYYLHLGIYAYRREFLLQFAAWAPTPLERTEKLEQLRALEHGRRIDVVIVERAAHGIDTPQQYAAFVRRRHHSQQEQGDACH